MEETSEFNVLMKIDEIFSKLDEATVVRILQWFSSKYSTTAAGRPTILSEGLTESVSAFQDVAEIFDAANPKTEPEKVLIVAYWFQEVLGRGDMDAQSINNQLKNLGHRVSNITRALDNLMNRRPRLVLQTRKNGTTQQARKKFRVTVEGVRRAQAMLNESTET